jgi:hypothetical protein
MQDDQIRQKFMGFAPADMARLPHLINTKKLLVVNGLVRQLGQHLCTLYLPCFTREIVHFWLDILLLCSSKISLLHTYPCPRSDRLFVFHSNSGPMRVTFHRHFSIIIPGSVLRNL